MSKSFYVLYAVKAVFGGGVGQEYNSLKTIAVLRTKDEAELLKKKICNGLYLLFPFKIGREDVDYLQRNFTFCDWEDCEDIWFNSIKIDECVLMHSEQEDICVYT